MQSITKAKHEIDMTTGRLSTQLLAFALPFMFTGIIQLLFNAADMVVVGSFVSETALAAVGSTTSLTHLLVNLFIGLSVGSGVAMSRSYGARDKEYGSKVLHTSIFLGLIAGVFIAILGVIVARPFWAHRLILCTTSARQCFVLRGIPNAHSFF